MDENTKTWRGKSPGTADAATLREIAAWSEEDLERMVADLRPASPEQSAPASPEQSAHASGEQSGK